MRNFSRISLAIVVFTLMSACGSKDSGAGSANDKVPAQKPGPVPTPGDLPAEELKIDNVNSIYFSGSNAKVITKSFTYTAASDGTLSLGRRDPGSAENCDSAVGLSFHPDLKVFSESNRDGSDFAAVKTLELKSGQKVTILASVQNPGNCRVIRKSFEVHFKAKGSDPGHQLPEPDTSTLKPKCRAFALELAKTLTAEQNVELILTDIYLVDEGTPHQQQVETYSSPQLKGKFLYTVLDGISAENSVGQCTASVL